MFRATMCPSSGADDCVILWPSVVMCCNNMWFFIDMSHCEWAVCGYEGFLVLFALLYVGLVQFIIRLKYIPWLQEGGQVRLVGSVSMDGFVSQLY